ncbi:hypothetical protein ABT272_28620 [Streptomyces sp900105245]|uniref:Uncharacterized protein n=1 Tax=Streptomyces sp. 900105245 TaxID=3154379 RepID=A0ABV1UDL7_9ACTN
MVQVKKYVVAAAVAGVLAGVPTVAFGFASSSGITTAASAATTAKAGQQQVNKAPVSGVRVVAPGERVQVKPGFELWLTKDGKHWSTPEVKNSFRSVVDGNQTKGVSVQEEGSMATGAFLSGVFMGKGEASRVVIRTRDGEITGTVVTLAGKPGWGAWYATSSAKPSQKVGIEALMDPYVRSVTVYDASGGIVAQSDIHALTKKKVDIQ